MARQELTPEINRAIKGLDVDPRTKLGPSKLSRRTGRAQGVCSRWINGEEYIERGTGVGPSLAEIPIIDDAYEVVTGTILEAAGYVDSLGLVLQKIHPDYHHMIRSSVEVATELTEAKEKADEVATGQVQTGRLFNPEPAFPKAS